MYCAPSGASSGRIITEAPSSVRARARSGFCLSSVMRVHFNLQSPHILHRHAGRVAGRRAGKDIHEGEFVRPAEGARKLFRSPARPAAPCSHVSRENARVISRARRRAGSFSSATRDRPAAAARLPCSMPRQCGAYRTRLASFVGRDARDAPRRGPGTRPSRRRGRLYVTAPRSRFLKAGVGCRSLDALVALGRPSHR